MTLGEDQIEERIGGDRSRLPDESITFNPKSDEDLESLLSKFGPEGLYEISWKLQKVASDDMEMATNDIN